LSGHKLRADEMGRRARILRHSCSFAGCFERTRCGVLEIHSRYLHQSSSWVAPHTRHSLLRVHAPSMENACTESNSQNSVWVVWTLRYALTCALTSFGFCGSQVPAVRVRRAGRPRARGGGTGTGRAACRERRQRGTAFITGFDRSC
jgi:hypothetical protein